MAGYTSEYKLGEDLLTPLGQRPEVTGYGSLPSEAERREAVAQSAGLGIGGVSVVPLTAIEDVIGDLVGLSVYAGRVTEVGVLAGGMRLEWLQLGAALSGRVDLSGLPALRGFEGPLSAPVASVAANPNLEVVHTWGPLSKRLPAFAGPVSEFRWGGARSQTAIPSFTQPEALRSFLRSGVARFDFAELEQFENLESVRIEACPDLVGVETLARLPRLRRLHVISCSSTESWESVPDTVQELLFHEVKPLASRAWMQAGRARGWMLDSWLADLTRAEARQEDTELFPVRGPEDGEDEEWGVVQYDASWLDGPLSAHRDLGPASGLDVQRLLKRMVRELRAQGVVLRPQFDSESGMFAAYFTDQAQAERFAVEARALAADPTRIHHYLNTRL